MIKQLQEDLTFENIDYSEQTIGLQEFVHCTFINCNFTKANLSNSDFADCQFKNCNLSLALLNNTGLKNVHFLHCKLMGINFSVCNKFLFGATFQTCILDLSSFMQKKMKKTIFIDCTMKEVDFTGTDLTQAAFKNCDLLNANFRQSILEKADFRTAINYSFDPELNKIKNAKFSSAGALGLLAKYEIDIE